jgi:hypothetical protein
VRPNFLIVGAAKAGTTSLWNYLRGHPQAFLPGLKEPNYFLTEEPLRTVRQRAEYERLFDPAPPEAAALGEASVHYLFDPGSAERIRDELGPDVRVVVMLRDPANAAHSLWKHNVRVGGERASFPEAVAANDARAAGAAPVPRGWLPGRHYAYLDRVRYSRQIARFLEALGEDRVWIGIYEEFFAAPDSGFEDLCRFLGIDDSYTPPFVAHNRGGMPRSRWLADLTNRRALWREPLKRIFPGPVRDRIRARLNDWNRGDGRAAPLDPSLAEEIRRCVADDVAEVESRLGRPIPAWRPPPLPAAPERNPT